MSDWLHNAYRAKNGLPSLPVPEEQTPEPFADIDAGRGDVPTPESETAPTGERLELIDLDALTKPPTKENDQ